jgi:hypothetical protein
MTRSSYKHFEMSSHAEKTVKIPLFFIIVPKKPEPDPLLMLVQS